MATLLVPREQVRTVLVERIRAGEDLVTKSEIAESSRGHRDWVYLFAKWREHTIAELKAVYEGDDVPFEFDFETRTADHATPRSALLHTKAALEAGVKKLQDLVERLPLAEEPEALQPRPGKVDKGPRERASSDGGPNVFIIHGRAAGGFRDSVARFIEQLGLRPIILAEQASGGRTLIEKFEANALVVGYAIALLTPEDSAYGPGE